MKAFLLYRDRDFDLRGELPSNEKSLMQDLELNTLFNAMALGDEFLYEVAKKAVLTGLHNDQDTILYRQDIFKDCLNNSSIVREIYGIAVEAIEKKKKHYFGVFTRYPSSILHEAVEILAMSVEILKKLRNITKEHADKFMSKGFSRFFRMVEEELGDEYFASIQDHLRELRFRDGVLISAELGSGNKGTNYILRKPHDLKQTWMQRIFANVRNSNTIYIHERDDSGSRALSALRERGINLVSNAIAQSADHILNFFIMLRTELAFYIGCLNLHGQLAGHGEPVTFPQPTAPEERRHSFRGLYDVCLSLTLKQRIVGNDMDADNQNLVVITGANQGGKSTFLRSIGVSQLMMQSGMFVPAQSFCSNVCDGIFTHYKREEDADMNSGKLDEELSRMSDIVDNITSNSLILLNESFAATNEREGSEISRQIICALLEKRIKVFFVTHVYAFARAFYDKNLEDALFLRAERQADGGRTYKVLEGEPLQTSYGEDLYKGIFGSDD